MLNEQHRMHPQIAAWPSSRFYDGELRTAASVTSSPHRLEAPLGLVWPVADAPIALVRVSPVEGADNAFAKRGGYDAVRHGFEESDRFGSKMNRTEAAEVVEVVDALVQARLNEDRNERGSPEVPHVAVLTHYAAQKRLIVSLLTRAGVPMQGVLVSTVDAFQGQVRFVCTAPVHFYFLICGRCFVRRRSRTHSSLYLSFDY